MARKADGSGLKGISITDLHAELRRRQSGAKPLIKKRETLAGRLAAIDSELATLGISVSEGSSGRGGRVSMGMGTGTGNAGAGRKRPVNELNLVDSLAKILKGKTMGVSESAEAVQKAGYKTSAANFRTIVNQTLIKHKTIFKKVERGLYSAI